MTSAVVRPELARLAAELDAHLRRVLDEAREITRLAAADEPSADSLWAVAAHLHGFYNGVESILRMLVVALEGRPPEGPDSHARLLSLAAIDVPGVRPAIVSESTAAALRPYLGFRHFFRHAYGVVLRWEKMRDKAVGIGGASARFEADVRQFRQTLLDMSRDPIAP